MSADRCQAFRSEVEAVTTRWADYLAEVNECRDRRNALVDEMGGRRLYTRKAISSHATEVVGFESLSDDDPAELKKKGLRFDQRRGFLTPARNLKAGKTLQAKLDDLRSADVNLPGMPDCIFTGLAMAKPAMFEHGDALFVLWGTDEEIKEADSTLWSPIPLSTYYAAKEQFDVANPKTVDQA